MDCPTVQEQLGPYLDGELSADVRVAVEAHLTGCPHCAAAFDSLRSMAGAIAAPEPIAAPEGLWSSIAEHLDHSAEVESRPPAPVARLRLFSRPFAAAASLLLSVGLGIVGLAWLAGSTSSAEASTVDFSILLDALPLDARKAFRRFLIQYDAREAPVHAVRQYAPDLNFAIPESLPGGFRLEQAYTLRFGEKQGVAAAYSRDGEFLATIFHPPVHEEEYGGYKDYPCVIGRHRGHKVVVGPWKLVHLTDPTTCHCVLSKLDETKDLPAVMARVAPEWVTSPSNEHGHALPH